MMPAADRADVGQWAKRDDRIDVDVGEARIDAAEVLLEVVDERLRLAEGVGVLFRVQDIAEAAILGLHDPGHLGAPLTGRVGNRAAVVLHLDAEELAMGIHEEIALQPGAGTARVRDEGVVNNQSAGCGRDLVGDHRLAQRADPLDLARAVGRATDPLQRSEQRVSQGHPTSSILRRSAGVILMQPFA